MFHAPRVVFGGTEGIEPLGNICACRTYPPGPTCGKPNLIMVNTMILSSPQHVVTHDGIDAFISGVLLRRMRECGLVCKRRVSRMSTLQWDMSMMYKTKSPLLNK
jgi:hypothetical protein